MRNKFIMLFTIIFYNDFFVWNIKIYPKIISAKQTLLLWFDMVLRNKLYRMRFQPFRYLTFSTTLGAIRASLTSQVFFWSLKERPMLRAYYLNFFTP